MAFNFPSSPSANQIFTDAMTGIKYQYNAVYGIWRLFNQLYHANNQVLYNDANTITGNAGLVFEANANTLYVNTLAASSVNVSGNIISNRQVTIDYPTGQSNVALTIKAANTVGGTGYADVLRFINTSNTGVPDVTKTIRISTVGALEIVNSAYSSVSLTLTDKGDLSVPGNVTMGGIRPGYSAARPSFRVYGSTTTSWSITVNNTGYCNSSQWTVEHNQGSYLSAANGVFSVPVTGIYQINVVGRNAGNTTSISQLVVVKNATSGNGAGGTIVTMLEFAASSTMNHAGTSTSLLLNAGDTLVLRVSAGTIQFDSNDSWSVTYLG